MSDCLREQFLLDPNVVYLNHGSYGACPRPVWDRYQAWQRELELHPVRFIGERLPDLMAQAREALGAYLGVSGDDLVYFRNPTSAVRRICQSLTLNPGDEILTSNYEYPAMNDIWQYLAYRTGARYACHKIPVPVSSAADTVEALWAGVNERTRVIFLSHIAAFTALTLPVAEICHRAREAGILTFIDGAHVPGQMPLDLDALGADIYVGACHKWMCAPKGAGFAYARPGIQDRLVLPHVHSRGWTEDRLRGGNGKSLFVSLYQAQGTHDPAAALSVPAAIAFQQEHQWGRQRARCHELARQTRARIDALTGLEPLCPDSSAFFGQMVGIQIPDEHEAAIRRELDARRIVVVLLRVEGRLVLRVSYQAYNRQEDADLLVEAVAAGLGKCA